MKAAVNKLGGGRKWSSSVRIPEPGPKQVLVRVVTASPNPIDYKISPMRPGVVAGQDAAGVVEKVGKEVRGLEVGDRVVSHAAGCMAEFVLCNVGCVAKLPENWTFEQAAPLPTAYLSALQGLRDHGKMKEGDKVLVVGASGACGTAGVQLAKALGASEVVGVCSSRNVELVKELGADRVVDYTSETILEVVGDDFFDVVFDSVGGYVAKVRPTMKKGAMYVALNGGAVSWIKSLTGLGGGTEKLMMARFPSRDIRTVIELLDKTGARPHIGHLFKEFNFEEVERAYGMLKSHRTRGNLVLRINAAES
ncbi:NADPH-dependent alkenal/one oxidoreductase [Durusdinium trenchii]|uniref:Chloroplastic (AtAOR) n=1 Tax=Durusdinium trenchii TaxID=1381693 RepID=A0ABP0R961_9DINO